MNDGDGVCAHCARMIITLAFLFTFYSKFKTAKPKKAIHYLHKQMITNLGKEMKKNAKQHWMVHKHCKLLNNQFSIVKMREEKNMDLFTL